MPTISLETISIADARQRIIVLRRSRRYFFDKIFSNVARRCLQTVAHVIQLKAVVDMSRTRRHNRTNIGLCDNKGTSSMPDIQDCPNEQQAASGRAMCARSASYQIRVLTYVLGIFLAATGVVAEQQRAPLDREIWKKSQVFQPKPSFDTTPVTVKVVAVTYRIPRNYLTDLGPQLPAIKLAWPGLQPLTKENRECFGSVAQGQRAGCTSFNFLILGSGSPSGRDVSNSEKFESWQKSFPKLGTRRGPFGYDIHSVGPNEARTEVYRRVDGDIYFRCQLSEDRSRAVCNDMFRLDDMNHMQFYFRLEHIEHIASIEASMRKLVASFVLHKEE